MNTFSALIITPEKVLFEGEIIRLKVTLDDGGMEILAHHIPSLCALDTGRCEITLPDNTKKAFITEDGILNVTKDKVILNSDVIEWEEDFEKVLLERDKRMENDISRRRESYKEYKLGKVTLQQTLAVLKKERTNKR